MHDVRKKVTIVMTTFNNNDFTKSSIWAIRNFFPKVRIILTDGGSTNENLINLRETLIDDNLELMVLFNSPTEYCRNAAVSIINTPYVLFMDNDTKILSDEAVTSCIEILDSSKDIAQTGAYALKIIDKKNSKGYSGTEFNNHMEVTGFSAYFSMHKVFYYKEVGGMKINEFIYSVPEELWKGKKQPGWTGDFNIGNYYIKNNYKNITPKKKLPVLHWGKAYRSFSGDLVSDWCYLNWNNIRCNPLNDWEKMEKE